MLLSGVETPGSTASASLWSVPSTFPRRQRSRSVTLEGEDQQVTSKALTKVTIYSLAINTATIFCFPEAAYKYGGTFLLAYAATLVILAQPLVYTELLMGQLYLRKGPLRKPESIFGITFKGLQYAKLAALLLFLPNQSILGHFSNTLVDLSGASKPFPWCSCDSSKEPEAYLKAIEPSANATATMAECVSVPYINGGDLEINPFKALFTRFELAPLAYLRNDVLHSQLDQLPLLSPEGVLNFFNWKLLLCCLFSAAVTFGCTFDSRFRAPVTRVLSWVPFLFVGAMIVLLFSVLKISGRVAVLLQLFCVNFDDFSDVKMWHEAIRLSLLSSCLGFGLHSTVSSGSRMGYKKYYQISWMLVLMILIVAVVSAALCFAVIELLHLLVGTDSPVDVVPKATPGIVSVLMATVFCAYEPSTTVKCLYGLFYVIKFLAIVRIQILAVETVSRLLNLEKCRPCENRPQWLQVYATVVAIVVMQATMVFPYVFPPTQGLLDNFAVLSGCTTILVLFLVEISRLSGGKNWKALKEDLYLSHRLSLPTLFHLQVRCGLLHFVVVVCALLLSYEVYHGLAVKLEQFSVTEQSWQGYYGLVLSVIPLLLFLTAVCYKCMFRSKGSCRGTPVKVKRLRKRRKRIREAVKLETPAQELIIGSKLEDSVEREAFSATIKPSRLRMPQVDLVGDGDCGTDVEVATEQLSARTVYSSIITAVGCEAGNNRTVHSCPGYVSEVKIMSTSPSLTLPNPKKKPPRLTASPPHHRRPPLPPQWSPGGLGDFSLYNAHLNGKPPGPDFAITEEAEKTVKNEIKAVETHFEGSKVLTVKSEDVSACGRQPEKVASLTGDLSIRGREPEKVETEASQCDSQPQDSLVEELTVIDLPPPPPFLLEDYENDPDEPPFVPKCQVDRRQGNQDGSGGSSNGIEVVGAANNATCGINDGTVEVVGATNSGNPDMKEVTLKLDPSERQSSSHRIDLVSPKVAKELNISFGTDSEKSQSLLDCSVISSPSCDDGSSLCQSFLYTDETAL